MRGILAFPSLSALGALALLWMSAPGARAADLELTYRAYAAGFATLDFTVDLDLGQSGYDITLAYRTVGAAGFLFPGHAKVTARGSWTHDAAAPQSFESVARWRGRPYDVALGYHDGTPLVERLIPAEAKRREPVPASLQHGTIDTASAIALLLERMVQSGRCALDVRVFDGRRLMDLSARPAGTSDLGVTLRSFFHGPAERCEVTGKMLGGFLRSDGPAERRRLTHGVAWFAHPAPGYPSLPVRIAFAARWFGTSLIYLTNVKTVPTALGRASRRVAFSPSPGAPPRADPGDR